MLAQLHGNRQLVACKQNPPCHFFVVFTIQPLLTPCATTSSWVTVAKLSFLCLSHILLLPWNHLLCGKLVADSAAVPAKACHSYAGNWSVTTWHIVHSHTGLMQEYIGFQLSQWYETVHFLLGMFNQLIIIGIVIIIVAYQQLPSTPSQKCASSFTVFLANMMTGLIQSYLVLCDECWLISMIIINHH